MSKDVPMDQKWTPKVVRICRWFTPLFLGDCEYLLRWEDDSKMKMRLFKMRVVFNNFRVIFVHILARALNS